MRQPFLCAYKLCPTNSNVTVIIELILSYSPFTEIGHKFRLIEMRISTLPYRELPHQHFPYANIMYNL